MNRYKQLVINMTAQIIVFAVNMGINFFVTPYIVNQLGSEAYGFIGLANNFVNYASLITVALNSMASRFLSISFHRGEIDRANGYFNSLLAANTILAGVMLLPLALCTAVIDKLINVPAYLVFDVKCTFAIVFANFILSILMTAFSMSFFIKNKLYLNSLRTIESNVIKIAVILALFMFFKPRITYMAVGTLAASVFVMITNIYYHKKLLPEMQINRKYVNIRYIKTLLSSGIWNAITQMSQILSSGLDLLLSNLFISSEAMGVLALAKTVPNFIVSFITSISGVFIPDMTIVYAHNDMGLLVKTIKSNIKIMAVFSALPNAILIVLGTEFFRLWVPSEDAHLLWVLSILSVANSCITGPLQPLYSVFTVTNKINISSKVMLLYGALSFGITALLLKTTALGLYAIVCVSLLGSLIVSFAFHIPFSARIIGIKWTTFYPVVFKSVFSLLCVTALGFALKRLFPADTWPALAAMAALIGICGLFFNVMLILSKEERKMLLAKIKEKRRK